MKNIKKLLSLLLILTLCAFAVISCDEDEPAETSAEITSGSVDVTDETDIEPPVTTATPPVETTEPPAVTTEPPVITTEPPVVTTEPPAVTTEPPVVTTEPPAVTTEPPVVTTEPPVVTTEPPVVTTEPPVVTTEPPVVTTEPPVVTTEPPVVTTEPPHTHTPEPISGVAATCTAAGKTEGIRCAVCKEMIKAQVSIPATGHNEITDKAIAATCTAAGKTEGKHCSVCNTVITAQQTIPAKGHTEVTDKAVAATCTAAGKTEGKHCSVCNIVISAQTEIPATGKHSFGADGKCTVCGYSAPAVAGTKGLEYKLNEDKKSYSVVGIGTAADKDIVIPSVYNGLPVTVIGKHAFYENESITSVVIPEGVTLIEDGAFNSCSSLKSVKLPEGLAEIRRFAFAYCSNLAEVNLPEGLVKLAESVFQNCTLITSFEIPKTMTFIDPDAFAGCFGLQSITVAPGSTTFHATNGCLIETKAKRLVKAIKGFELPADGSITVIGKAAFSSAEFLEKIDIPEGVTAIEDGAFSWCINLKYIGLPSTLREIGQFAFESCTSLQDITIPEGITEIKQATFLGCNSMTSFILPKTIKKIGSYAFQWCTDLEYIEFNEGLLEIEEFAISNCRSIKYIDIPEGVAEIGEFAFGGCASAQAIVLPNSLKTIGIESFAHCAELENIDFLGTYEEWQKLEKKADWDRNTGKYTVCCSDVIIFPDGSTEALEPGGDGGEDGPGVADENEIKAAVKKIIAGDLNYFGGNGGASLFDIDPLGLDPEGVAQYVVYYYADARFGNYDIGGYKYSVPLEEMEFFSSILMGYKYDFTALGGAEGSNDRVYYDARNDCVYVSLSAIISSSPSSYSYVSSKYIESDMTYEVQLTSSSGNAVLYLFRPSDDVFMVLDFIKK